MNPFFQSDSLKSIMLGGNWSPGVVTLTGHDRDQAWDIVAPKGSTGASTKLNGAKVAQFQASFYLVSEALEGEEDDFSKWDRFQAFLAGMISGPAPIAHTIVHPDLARNGITEVTVAGIGGMIRDPQGGGTVQVQFLEYKPPKKRKSRKAKPKGKGRSTAREKKKQAPDPNAAAKRELAGLLRKARAA